MKEVRNGLKDDIKQVLGELEFNRHEDCSHVYKSLTDSLCKLVEIVSDYNLGTGEYALERILETGFYIDTLKTLETEAKEIRGIANKTLVNKDYKGYRNWLESLKRILSIHRIIDIKLNN